MENSQSVCSPTSLLLCDEIADDEEEEMEGFVSIVEDSYDNEYMQMLLDREIANGGVKLQEFLQNSRIQEARSDGIQYILRKREVHGFGFHTAYASVTYLDRFLSRRSIDAEKSWAMRLLSMACLSLAAKMEESTVPGLSDFCVENYNFENSVMQRMELLVLNTLEWKMGSITPFHFIQFFAEKFWGNSPPINGVSRTAEVILGTIRDVKIMCHRPSVIAAAATLVVLDHGFTRDSLLLKISSLSLSDSIKIEDIISCYYQVQEMNIERLKLSQGIESPDLSSIQLLRGHPYGSSLVTSAASAKRKRLVFNQNEQLDDLPSKKGNS